MGTRVRAMSALLEGGSLRATEWLMNMGKLAITALLLHTGDGCRSLHDARTTIAMQAGLADHLWTVEERVAAALAAPEPPLLPPEGGAQFGRLSPNEGLLPGQLPLLGVL